MVRNNIITFTELPVTIQNGETDFVTILLDVTILPLPIVIPFKIV